jgi:hypothetical protein
MSAQKFYAHPTDTLTYPNGARARQVTEILRAVV